MRTPAIYAAIEKEGRGIQAHLRVVVMPVRGDVLIYAGVEYDVLYTKHDYRRGGEPEFTIVCKVYK